MSAQHPIPFDFAALDANAVDPAPTPATISQEDVDRARAEARDETLRSVDVETRRRQTALLANIAEAVTTCVDSASAEIAAYKEDIAKVCREIVESFCLSASTQQAADVAGDLIDRYLNAEDSQEAAVLTLSSQCDDSTIEAAQDAVGAAGGITVTTSDALEPGDVTLSWRGGEMKRRNDDIRRQIAEIFARVSPPPANPTRKGPPV